MPQTLVESVGCSHPGHKGSPLFLLNDRRPLKLLSPTKESKAQKVEICRESFTQTSKTLLALVKEMEKGKLSPDSLSPKKDVGENKDDKLTSERKSNIKPCLDSPEKRNEFNFLSGYNRTKPVRYFCQARATSSIEQDPSPSKPRRSMSFMSPTISSGNKDQGKEIRCLNKLISPTRRGRSASPKKNQNEVIKPKKVPYIDISEESIQERNDTSELQYTDKSKPSVDRSTREIKSGNTKSSGTLGSATSASSTDSILCQALNKLRDPDWNVALRGLAEIVEMCRILDADFAYPHMTVINQRLIELMKSPRSHVCRTACQAVGHLFEYVKDTRRPEFDEIVDTLLCRTADANKFIRHDANLALDCLVTHISTFHTVRALSSKGPTHKNPLVRIATARLLVCAIILAGPQNILNPNGNEFTRKRIILNMVRFLEDKDMDTRKYGERIYKLFYKDRIFDIYLKRYLERDVVTKIKKCLKPYNGEQL
ncbi:hypothetical protein NQ317_003674 [Molorchus minor]|uniref:TOG domain-containing protein n=1 Tax=Molorchus minor TaxID=1323400 RepID=A0ABQ9JPT6_9CUCU|nr:hypothetical protein NQ317_003674 [Molorchus minor]